MNGNGQPIAEGERCPPCQARFRALAACPRCGADLTPLMLLSAHAYSRRQAARRLLRAGRAQEALSAVKTAQQLHSTQQGRILETVCAAVIAEGGGRPATALPSSPGMATSSVAESNGAPGLSRSSEESSPCASDRRLGLGPAHRLWKTLGWSAAAALVFAAGVARWRRE